MVRRIGDHGQRFERGAPDLHGTRVRQRIPHLRRGFTVAQQAGGLQRLDLNFFLQIAQQETDARRRRRIANFLDSHQRLIHQLVVFGAQSLDQIRYRRTAAQHTQRPRRIGARIQARSAAREFPQRDDHVRPHLHEGIDHLVVGIGEFAGHRTCRRAKACPLSPVLT